MQQVDASEFKRQCLRLLDELQGDGLVITKRGKPIAKVIPIRASSKLIGSMKGKLEIKGNILSTGIRWNAQARRP